MEANTETESKNNIILGNNQSDVHFFVFTQFCSVLHIQPSIQVYALLTPTNAKP
jgi:hypothetical protein